MIKIFRRIRQQLLSENKFSKYGFYAIGEIILVVIGILIALQINNWNETRQQESKVFKYAKSLVEDLKADIEMLQVSQFQANKKAEMIDSLRNMVNTIPTTELSSTDLWVICHDMLYRPYKWNRSTLNELNSSGSTRFIKNESVQNKLVAYESFSKHLDQDFGYDINNSQKADEQISFVINLNSPYLYKLKKKENQTFNDTAFNIFKTKDYEVAKANDLDLLTTDTIQIIRFTNAFILVQEQYMIRVNEMQEIIENAEDLIHLLNEDYQL